MLKDETALYTELTGKDGNDTPIGIIGAYLDGYEKGKASAQPEIIHCRDCKHNPKDTWFECPMTQPERKTGRWLWFDGVRCSNCNHKLQTTGLPTVCPNCGAKMESEDE